MSDIYIKVNSWSDVAKKIESANKVLHDLIAPISDMLITDMQDHFYQMNFMFGEAVIREGQMMALEKDRNGNYANESKIKFVPEGFSGKRQNDFKKFVEDCEQNTDHPLSIVTSNYIEIFCTKRSSLQSVGEYSFPLNIIEKGNLFGVWGSVNSIFKVDETDYYPWNAVAGKACIIPLFPEPQHKKSSDHYRKKFSTIFSKEDGTRSFRIKKQRFRSNEPRNRRKNKNPR